MSRTALPYCLVKHFKDEEQTVLAKTDPNRYDLISMYQKARITVDDLVREFTPKEQRMLAERTKVRVDMNKWNFLWDAKQKFDEKKRLENRPESFVNRMFEKAYTRRMVPLYTDREIEKYKAIAACETKKDNIVRLEIWSRQNSNEDRGSEEVVNSAEQPAAAAETGENSVDWIEIDEGINSEDMTIRTISLSSDTEAEAESDINTFATQAVATFSQYSEENQNSF